MQFPEGFVPAALAEKEVAQLPWRLSIVWGEPRRLAECSLSALYVANLVAGHSQFQPEIIIARAQLGGTFKLSNHFTMFSELPQQEGAINAGVRIRRYHPQRLIYRGQFACH